MKQPPSSPVPYRPPQVARPPQIQRQVYLPSNRYRRRRPRPLIRLPRVQPCCCLTFLLLGVLFLFTSLYFLLPVRTNILVLGLDYADWDSPVARSDTMILTSIVPLRPYVGMLSIPRDLWVVIPNVGENRINTAHFFAESQNPGSGPQAALDTISLNMGVTASYYLRIKFYGFREVVDALGGVDIDLPVAMAGYPAGLHHLTGGKALAFVRNRAYADDFQRMQQAQVMIKALFKNMLQPRSWPRLPGMIKAALQVVDTNIPVWLWPRLGLAVLRAGPGGIDSRVIGREMVTPFTTNQGAQVLLPNWEIIYPVVNEMFR